MEGKFIQKQIRSKPCPSRTPKAPQIGDKRVKC